MGWRDENDILKEACNFSSTTYVFDAEKDKCSITSIDILPNLRNTKISTVASQVCCDNAGDNVELKKACPPELDYGLKVYNEALNWDEARAKCA